MSKNDRSGKAALLTELLGEARVADLRKSGFLPSERKEKPDPATVAWHRNRLISKFRERGLMPDGRENSSPKDTSSAQKSLKKKASKLPPEFTPGGIGSRLAKHLNPERLADEHPAVIALFLKSQTPQLRSQVLRGLPGGQARAVMRVLRTGSAATSTVAPEPQKDDPAPVPEIEMVEMETPTRPPLERTRRAR